MKIKEKLKKLSEYDFSDIFFKEIVLPLLSTTDVEDFKYLIAGLNKLNQTNLYVGYLRNDIVFVMQEDDELTYMINSEISSKQIAGITPGRDQPEGILMCEISARGFRGVDIDAHLIVTDPVIDVPTLWDELGISHRTGRSSRRYEGGRRGR